MALSSSAAQSETVITVNQGLRGGKVIELKKTVEQAVKQCPGVKRVLVSMRTDSKVPLTALDVPLEEVRGCLVLLLLPLGSVSTLGAGTGGGERVPAGRDSFGGIDVMQGHCPAAAVAAGAAHKFRGAPGAIRGVTGGSSHSTSPVRGRQCKPGLTAGRTRG